MYDVTIIGLGPAGATLARRLDSRFSVAALDKKPEAPPPAADGDCFRKPCGGLLAPDAQKALARFNLTLPREVLVDPQIFSVRTIDLDHALTRYYQRFYVNIDRDRFDRWLMGHIPPGVARYSGAVCRDISRTAEGYRVRFLQNGVEQALETRYIVGADGANSMVRRHFFPEVKPRRYVAIQQWFPETNAAPFYSCIFDSEDTDCYSWSISKDGYFIFGGAFPPQNCRERFERQKQKLAGMGFSFGELVKTESCLVLRPASGRDFCTGRDGVFLIGEAAGFVSPSSLEGISSALLSGDALARVLNSSAADPAKQYRRATRGLRLKLLGKLAKCPFMYWPALRKLVMKSGLESISVEESGR